MVVVVVEVSWMIEARREEYLSRRVEADQLSFVAVRRIFRVKIWELSDQIDQW